MQRCDTRRQDGYLPLASYGALGDGRSVALTGGDGSVDWWCVPQLDSPPLFDRILDAEEGGFFSITPAEEFSVKRAYRANSNVLETIFETAGGSARLTESLNSGVAGRLPWSELARRIEGIDGTVHLSISFKPGTRFGTATAWVQANPNATVLHLDGIVILVCVSDEVTLSSFDDSAICGYLTTTAGSRSTVAIVATEHAPLVVPAIEAIDSRIDGSDAGWRRWAERLTVTGPYSDTVRRSALALKLLLFSPTGAIAAAATTSLPEGIGGTKTFDYRFAWMRDTAYTAKAFLRVGAEEEVQAAFAWIMRVIQSYGSAVGVFYTLDCQLPPEQTEVPLIGYRRSGPVHIGNGARSQKQLNVYGDLLETAWLFVDRGHVLDSTSSRFLASLADRCADEWRQPDSGIWELAEQQHYTFSKIGCWVALDRAAKLARAGHIDGMHRERWERERERIREWIDKHCWSEKKQAYVQFPGSEKLDASLLLATRFGFASKDRLDLTRAAIQGELCRGPLVYRYSGVQAEEGAFIACSFWLVEAFAFLGHLDDAKKTMEQLLKITDVNNGLLNEMMDPDTHEMLGNFPQGLSHLALIHAANAIADAEKSAT